MLGRALAEFAPDLLKVDDARRNQGETRCVAPVMVRGELVVVTDLVQNEIAPLAHDAIPLVHHEIKLRGIELLDVAPLPTELANLVVEAEDAEILGPAVQVHAAANLQGVGDDGGTVKLHGLAVHREADMTDVVDAHSPGGGISLSPPFQGLHGIYVRAALVDDLGRLFRHRMQCEVTGVTV